MSNQQPSPSRRNTSPRHVATGKSDERAPLLSAHRSEVDANSRESEAAGFTDDSQTTKSVWYLIILTISIGGLQIAWSVELSNGSPFLLSLGLSKSLVALVWIAGPLSGILAYPYVGMLSDNCRSSWGKRKPFMLGGAAVTTVSLLFLAWTKEIVRGNLGVFGADPESQAVRATIIVVAIIGVYVLDFAIVTAQASIRAFILDCCPAHQQEAANAMASRMTGVGNILGYLAGYIDLPKYLWFLGDTQFKILCAIAGIALGTTVILSCCLIQERDPRLDGPPPKHRPNIFLFFATLAKSFKRLPLQVKMVCQVQFTAWVGFFPLLFYTSSYIGELYVDPYLRGDPNMSPGKLEKLYERATRIGTFALLINAIVSLFTNVFLPFIVEPTYDTNPVHLDGLKDAGDESHSVLDNLRIPGFTLRRAWLGSLVFFALAMFSTIFIQSVKAATVMIALVGITWAMTLWAPYAIVSAEVSRRDALARAKKGKGGTRDSTGDGGQNESSVTEDNSSQDVDQAGVILGIHNMAIAAPQIISNLGSSLIFKIWQKPRGVPGDRSFSIVYALGGVFVLASCIFVYKIRDDTSTPGRVAGDYEQEAIAESAISEA